MIQIDEYAFQGGKYLLYGDRSAKRLVVMDGTGMDEALGLMQEAKPVRDRALFAFVPVSDWDGELTPWPSDCIPGRAFAGNGKEHAGFISLLVREIDRATGTERSARDRAIAGYSLAGLSALYTQCVTGDFARAASVSGALWYPSFAEYYINNIRFPENARLYMSLGKQEVKRGNPLMRMGGDAADRIEKAVRETGTDVRFEWNNGNHFMEPHKRIVKALDYLLEDTESA